MFYCVLLYRSQNENFINEDGSGVVKTEFIIQKELSLTPGVITKLKDEIKENNWKIISEVEKDDKYIIKVQREFKDISDLNSNITIYEFSTVESENLKRIYTFKVKFIDDLRFMPCQIVVKVPGEIDDTNGMRISSNESKWEFIIIQNGTKLYAQSSSTIPKLLFTFIVLTLLFPSY